MARKKASGTHTKTWDLKNLSTDTVAVDKEVDRVHPIAFGSAEFNNSGKGDARFSPIKDNEGNVIPTMYAAETYEGALMETAFHDVPNGPSPKIVRKKKLEPLCRSKLQIKEELKVADLTSVGIKNIIATKAEVIESPPSAYPLTRSLAEAIHDHDSTIQGIQWVSKQHDRGLAFLFFGDRIPDGTFDPSLEKHPILEGLEGKNLLKLADKIGVTIGD